MKSRGWQFIKLDYLESIYRERMTLLLIFILLILIFFLVRWGISQNVKYKEITEKLEPIDEIEQNIEALKKDLLAKESKIKIEISEIEKEGKNSLKQFKEKISKKEVLAEKKN